MTTRDSPAATSRTNEDERGGYDVRRAARTQRSPQLLTRLLAIVVLLGLFVAGWQAVSNTRPLTLSMRGLVILQPGRVLNAAEGELKRRTGGGHARTTESTRCYFAATPMPQPRRYESRRYELSGDVLCGPVLFIDGDPARQYASFTVQPDPVAAGRAKLSIRTIGLDQVAGPAEGAQLIRPDGTGPAGRSRLTAPTPPPSRGDVLTRTTTLGSAISTAPANATMIGMNAGVALRQFGFTDRFGSGNDAHTAPPGFRLLAFAVEPLAGEYANNLPNLAISIDGSVRGPLVSTTDYIVSAIPYSARQVDLLLTDAGTTQRISLLTGQPSPENPLVSSRRDRSQELNLSRPVTVRVTQGSKTGLVGGTVTFSSVWLSYWGRDGSAASKRDRAFLHVALSVRLAGDSQAYGADTSLLSARLPGQASVPARNAAQSPQLQVDNVIEVPATTTSGSLLYAGHVTTPAGTLTVLTPIRVAFALTPPSS